MDLSSLEVAHPQYISTDVGKKVITDEKIKQEFCLDKKEYFETDNSENIKGEKFEIPIPDILVTEPIPSQENISPGMNEKRKNIGGVFLKTNNE